MQLSYLKKANVFFGIIVIIFVVIIIRLIHLQIYQHKKYRSLQFSQAYLKVDCQPETGMIFDRNGEILALSRLVDSVYVVPQELDNHPVEIQKLAVTLEMDKEGLSAKITQAKEQNKFFLWVKRRIDDETSKKITALNIKGVGLKKEYKRFYPKETSACHLIGYRGMDEQALEGIELSANNYLKGEVGYQYLHRDARRRLFTSELPEKPAQPLVPEQPKPALQQKPQAEQPRIAEASRKPQAQKPAGIRSAPRKPEAQKPSPQKPAPARTVRGVDYWIQTGSYRSQTKAEDLARLLGDKGISARVFSSTVSGGDMYFRVRIGPYGNKNEAGKFLAIVKQIEGLESSYISSVAGTRTIN